MSTRRHRRVRKKILHRQILTGGGPEKKNVPLGPGGLKKRRQTPLQSTRKFTGWRVRVAGNRILQTPGETTDSSLPVPAKAEKPRITQEKTVENSNIVEKGSDPFARKLPVEPQEKGSPERSKMQWGSPGIFQRGKARKILALTRPDPPT